MTGCRLGRDVQQAAISGRWATALREHVEGCRSCREIASVTATLAAAPVPPPSTVRPAVLWIRAKHARRLRAEAMVSRIITAGQIGAGVVGLGLLLFAAGQIETWSSLASVAPVFEYAAWTVGVGGLTAAGILAMTRRHTEI